MIERGTSSQQIAIIRKQGAGPVFRGRPKRDHAAYQGPQPALCQYVSVCPPKVPRALQGEAWRFHQPPMETSMSEESDADAATSTPGGGHSL
jgi:hypothetical protein